jgi:citrate lyase subunit beta/citryl-CoA lyase
MHMSHRSWLLVPGHDEDQLLAAVGTGADVIVVDLADSVARADKPLARTNALNWLSAHRRQILESRPVKRWVRVNSLDSGLWRDDLVAVMAGAPDGIVLPRSMGPESVRQIAAEVYELEQRHQVPAGSIRILPSAGDTAAAVMQIGSYCDAPHARLAGLTWASAPLLDALGATRSLETRGLWTDTFRFVRTQTLLTAHACQLMAIEAAQPECDAKGLKSAAADARADGFTGMMATHRDQVAVINAAFTPSDSEVTKARAIVSAFSQNPGYPTLEVDGHMVEQTHLRHARHMLGLDGSAAAEPIRNPILRPA